MTTTKIRFVLAALALAVAGSANASTINWGSITAPDSKNLSDYFEWPDHGDFSDRYNFTLTNEANSFGGLLEVDPRGSFLGIDIDYIALYKGFTKIDSKDYSPGAFAFNDLGPGSYSFYVVGSISWFSGGFGDEKVGYKGTINFKPDATTSVPEPSTLALAGIGLLGLAFAMRRRLFN
jgi:hypothetical protein